MYLIRNAFKNAGRDIWDELLYLIIFNVIYLIGMVLIIPWPFVTFGLFEMAYDVGQGKGIKFGNFFTRAAAVWKQAYIWGIINIIVAIVLFVNLNFYATFTATWAGIAQVLAIGISVFWFVLQLVSLAMYPRLNDPGFKLATRNAAVLVGHYPIPVVVLFLFLALFLGASVLVRQCNWVILLGVVSFSAVLTNRMVEGMLKKELGENKGENGDKFESEESDWGA